MEKSSAPVKSVYSVMGALIGWFAVIGQLSIMLKNETGPVVSTVIQFLSFFTIIANIMVALVYTAEAFDLKSAFGNFFKRSGVQTSIAVYIFLVGLVYNLVLRQTWSPTGFQRIIDEMLHAVVPALYFIYWILFVSHKRQNYNQVLSWLWYPLIYLVYSIIRGAMTDIYMYPFMNVTKLGYGTVIRNSALLLVVFFVVSLIFVFVTQRRSRTISPSR